MKRKEQKLREGGPKSSVQESIESAASEQCTRVTDNGIIVPCVCVCG